MDEGPNILDKIIHDIFHLGSGTVFNNQQYVLDKIMIVGTSDTLYTVLRFSDKNGKNFVCGVDVETNIIFPLSSEQSELYHKILKNPEKRLIKGNDAKILNYNS